MELIKGADVSSAIHKKLKNDLSSLSTLPHLAIIRIGENPDDISYEKNAKKRMEKIGMRCSSFIYPKDISNETFIHEFQNINKNPDIHAILLLRPLPKQIDESFIERLIDPCKDIDGISPQNMAKVFAGDPSGFAPCTAEAVLEILRYADIPLDGKKIAIIGRSLVVGKPLSMLLLHENATITICHTHTVDIENVCQQADIVIAAAGKAHMLNRHFIRKGCIVIDVGINLDENFKLCGDVDLEDISELALLATPVPGGVGTVTTSVLAKHVLLAAKFQLSQKQ